MGGTRLQPRRGTARPKDLPERRRAKAATPRVESLVDCELQAVLDSVDNALLLLDAQGQIQWANARFHQWMGIAAAEWAAQASGDAVARRLSRQFRNSEQFLARWGVPEQNEEAVWDELELLKPERRLLERLSRPVFNAAGKPIGRLEVYRDITAGRLIHSKLLQTEKMAALGQLVSGIAHELNNPLTSIMGYAQLALAHEAHSREGPSNAARIFEEAQRAQRIVRNLLVFAREARPERAPVQLNEVVERTLSLRSYELRVRNIAVHLDLEPGLPRTTGDAHQLQQVMLNLLVNAEHAIESRAARKVAPGVAIGHIGIRTGRAGDERILLEVCDDGAGISSEVASRIFDPFFTTKPVGEGTGLGLSIAYGIVREHGGEISVTGPSGRFRSSPWQSIRWRTSFVVELPVRSSLLPGAAAEIPRAPAALAALPGRSRAQHPPRVLVVEDEQTVARLIGDVLREEGMAAEVALGGQQGLERLLAARGDGGYDLVICDLKMPGLDGPALYRELLHRNHPAKDRMLFITGDTLSRRTLEFVEKYKAPFLAKPFLADELRAAVRRCLGATAEVLD